MHKVVPVIMVAAFGAALMSSAAGPYELAARQMEINRTPAAEVLKVHAVQEAMHEELGRPALPPGMTIVVPRNGNA
jgi:hypothetical protein